VARSALEVLKAVHGGHGVASTVVEAPEVRELLRAIGVEDDGHGTWRISPQKAERFFQIETEVRARFHAVDSERRYTEFANLVQDLAVLPTSRRQGGVDIERGFLYEETAEMALDQRREFLAFIRRWEGIPGLVPILGGLSQLIEMQMDFEDEAVCGWELPAESLVERGVEFSKDCVKLILIHLNAQVKNNESLMTFAMDPQLSNSRLQKLLAYFGESAKHKPGAGRCIKLGEIQRTNKHGKQDARIPLKDELKFVMIDEGVLHRLGCQIL